MDSDLHYLSIADLSKLVHARKLSPVELTRALLDRIGSLEPQLNAFIAVTGELALKQAKRAEDEIAKGTDRGALHGNERARQSGRLGEALGAPSAL